MVGTWDGSFWCKGCHKPVGEGGPFCGRCRRDIPGELRLALDHLPADTVGHQAVATYCARHLAERRRLDEVLEPVHGGEGGGA